MPKLDTILAELDDLDFDGTEPAPEPLVMNTRETRKAFSESRTAKAVRKLAGLPAKRETPAT